MTALWFSIPSLAVYAQPDLETVSVRADILATECVIQLDGRSEESCWAGAPVHIVKHEQRPHPGSAPLVGTRYRIVQDTDNLYVFVECDEQNPENLRYVWGRRDKVLSDQDSISVYIDPIGTRTFAQLFRTNPVGSVTDGTFSEASLTQSLDQDFEFEVATRIHESGWTAEFKIPFRSLRYGGAKAGAAWTMLVTRNYPRNDRYVYASAPIVQNSDCFLCKNPQLVGLMPPDSPRYLSVTPYFLGRKIKQRLDRARTDSSDTEIGVDLKVRLGASTFLDATINPDFSQVEVDAPQLSASARFGLYFREKRPFFLEGADLLDAPLTLAYTRTIGDPRAGVRFTHRSDQVEALAISAQDRGGTAVMYPGPWSSYPIVRDTRASIALFRSRFTLAPSTTAGTTVSVRDSHDGSRNAVLGGDFAWQLNDDHKIRALLAMSDTRKDARRLAEGATEVDPGQGGAMYFDHSYYGEHVESLVTLERVGARFRSENGFIGQVGHLRAGWSLGYRFGRWNWFSEVKPYISLEENRAVPGGTVYRQVHPALQLLGPSLGLVAELHLDKARADQGLVLHSTPQVLLSGRWTPGPNLTFFQIDVEPGRRLDYATNLSGPGLRVLTEVGLRVLRRTELSLKINYERINHDMVGRLLYERNAQIIASHSLSSNSWARLIVQSVLSSRANLSVPSVTDESRRMVNSLVYAFEPWPSSSVSIGFSTDVRNQNGGKSRINEAFLKVTYSAWRVL